MRTPAACGVLNSTAPLARHARRTASPMGAAAGREALAPACALGSPCAVDLLHLANMSRSSRFALSCSQRQGSSGGVLQRGAGGCRRSRDAVISHLGRGHACCPRPLQARGQVE